jgi:hypothetical protein
MPLFKVGDHVERIGVLAPEHMKSGRILRVIPHNGISEVINEYVVAFEFGTVKLYGTQLGLLAEDRTDGGSIGQDRD